MKHTKEKGRAAPKGRRRLEFGAPKQQLPLLNKAVYMDIKNSRQADLMEEQLRKLGARVEKFLSVEVNYVISSSGPSKPDEKVSREENPQSPSFVPSPFNCGPSSAVQPDAKTVVVSRGKALAQIACAKNKVKASSVVTSAEKLGIKVVSADAATKWLEKEIRKMKQGMESSIKENKSKKAEVKLKDSKTKSKLLTGSFIKVEDCSRHYRPVKVELDRWPRLNLSAPPGICPFGEAKMKVQNLYGARNQLHETSHVAGCVVVPAVPIHPASIAEEEEEEARSVQKPVAQVELVGVPIGTTGDAKRILNFHFKKNLAINKQQGYCDCCGVKFQNIDEHLKGEEHRSFARQKSNYESLDALISQIPSTVDFLQSVLLKHCVQRHEEPTVSSCHSTPFVNLLPPISPLTTEKTNVLSQETAATCLKTPDPSGQDIATFKEHFTVTDTDLISKRDTVTPTKQEPVIDSRPQAVVIRRPMPSGMFTSPRRRPITPSKKPWMQERSMVFSDSPIGSLQPSPCTGKESLPHFLYDNTVNSLNKLANVCDKSCPGKPNRMPEASKVTKNLFSIILNQNFAKLRKKKSVTAQLIKKVRESYQAQVVDDEQEKKLNSCHLEASGADTERNFKHSCNDLTTEDKIADFHHEKLHSVAPEPTVEYNQVQEMILINKESEVNDFCDERMITAKLKSELCDIHNEECIAATVSHRTQNLVVEEGQLKDSENKSAAVNEEIKCLASVEETCVNTKPEQKVTDWKQEIEMTAKQKQGNIDSCHDNSSSVEQEMDCTDVNRESIMTVEQVEVRDYSEDKYTITKLENETLNSSDDISMFTEQEMKATGYSEFVTVKQEMKKTVSSHVSVVMADQEMEKTASDHGTVITAEQEMEVAGYTHEQMESVEQEDIEMTSLNNSITVEQEQKGTGSSHGKTVMIEQEVMSNPDNNSITIEQEKEVTGFSHDNSSTIEQEIKVTKSSLDANSTIEQEIKVTRSSHDVNSTIEQEIGTPGSSHDVNITVRQEKEVADCSHHANSTIEQDKKVTASGHDDGILIEQEKTVTASSHDDSITTEEKEVTRINHDNDFTVEPINELTEINHDDGPIVKQEQEGKGYCNDRIMTVGDRFPVTEIHCLEKQLAVEKKDTNVFSNEKVIPVEEAIEKKDLSHEKRVLFEEENKDQSHKLSLSFEEEKTRCNSCNEKCENFVDKNNTTEDICEGSATFEQTYSTSCENITIEQEMEEVCSKQYTNSTVCVLEKGEIGSTHCKGKIDEEEIQEDSSSLEKMGTVEDKKQTISNQEPMEDVEKGEVESSANCEKEITVFNEDIDMIGCNWKKDVPDEQHDEVINPNHEKWKVVIQGKEESDLDLRKSMFIENITVTKCDTDVNISNLEKCEVVENEEKRRYDAKESRTAEQGKRVNNSSHENNIAVVKNEKKKVSDHDRDKSVKKRRKKKSSNYEKVTTFEEKEMPGCVCTEDVDKWKEIKRSSHDKHASAEEEKNLVDSKYDECLPVGNNVAKTSSDYGERLIDDENNMKIPSHEKSTAVDKKKKMKAPNYGKEKSGVRRKKRRGSNLVKHLGAEEESNKDSNYDQHVTVENEGDKTSSHHEQVLTNEQRSQKKDSNNEESKSVERRKERNSSNHQRSASVGENRVKGSDCKVKTTDENREERKRSDPEKQTSAEETKSHIDSKHKEYIKENGTGDHESRFFSEAHSRNKDSSHEKYITVEDKKKAEALNCETDMSDKIKQKKKRSNHEKILSVVEKDVISFSCKDGMPVEKSKERSRSSHEKHVTAEERKRSKDSNHEESKTFGNNKRKDSSLQGKGLTDEQKSLQKNSNFEKEKTVKKRKERKRSNEKHASVEERKNYRDSKRDKSIAVERKNYRDSKRDKSIAVERKNYRDSKRDKSIAVERKNYRDSKRDKSIAVERKNYRDSKRDKNIAVERKNYRDSKRDKSIAVESNNKKEVTEVHRSLQKDSNLGEDKSVEKGREMNRSNHEKHESAGERKRSKDVKHGKSIAVESNKEKDNSLCEQGLIDECRSLQEDSKLEEKRREKKRSKHASAGERNNSKDSNDDRSIAVEIKIEMDSSLPEKGLIDDVHRSLQEDLNLEENSIEKRGERKRSKHRSAEEMKGLRDSKHDECNGVEYKKEIESYDLTKALIDELRNRDKDSSHEDIAEDKKKTVSKHREDTSIEQNKERRGSNHNKPLSTEERKRKDDHVAVDNKEKKRSRHERELTPQQTGLQKGSKHKDGKSVERRKDRKSSNNEKSRSVEEKERKRSNNDKHLDSTHHKYEKEKESSHHERILIDEQRNKKNSSGPLSNIALEEKKKGKVSNCEEDKSGEVKKESKISESLSVVGKDITGFNYEKEMPVERRDRESFQGKHLVYVETNSIEKHATVEIKKEMECSHDKELTGEQRNKQKGCEQEEDKRKERKRSHEKYAVTQEMEKHLGSKHDESLALEHKKEKERSGYEKRSIDEARNRKRSCSHGKHKAVEENRRKVSDCEKGRPDERKLSSHERNVSIEKKGTFSSCKEDTTIENRKERKRSNSEKHETAEEKKTKKDCVESTAIEKVVTKSTDHKNSSHVQEEKNRKDSDNIKSPGTGRETQLKNMNPVVRISGRELGQCIASDSLAETVYKHLAGRGLGAQACSLIYVASHKDNINNLLLKEGHTPGQTSQGLDSGLAHTSTVQSLIKNKNGQSHSHKTENRADNKKTSFKMCKDVGSSQIGKDIHEPKMCKDDVGSQTGKGVHGSKTGKDVHVSKICKDVHDSKIGKNVHDSKMCKDVDSSKTGKDVHVSKICKDVHDSKIGKNVHDSKMCKDVDSSKTGKDVHVSKICKDVHDSKIGKNVHDSKMCKDVDSSKTGKDVHVSKICKDVHDSKIGKNVHDSKMCKDVDSSKTGKDVHHSKIVKDVHDSKISKDFHVSKICKDVHVSKICKDFHVSKICKDVHVSKICKDVHVSKICKDVHDSKIGKDVHDSKICKDVISKTGKEVRHSKIVKDVHHSKLVKDVHHTKTSKDVRGSKNDKDIHDSKIGKDVHVSKISNDVNRVCVRDAVKSNQDSRHVHLDKTTNAAVSTNEASDKSCANPIVCPSNRNRSTLLNEQPDICKTMNCNGKEVIDVHRQMDTPLQKPGKEYEADEKACNVEKYSVTDRESLRGAGQVDCPPDNKKLQNSNMKQPVEVVSVPEKRLNEVICNSKDSYMDEDTVDTDFYESHKGGRQNSIVNTDELDSVRTTFPYISGKAPYSHSTEPRHFPHNTVSAEVEIAVKTFDAKFSDCKLSQEQSFHQQTSTTNWGRHTQGNADDTCTENKKNRIHKNFRAHTGAESKQIFSEGSLELNIQRRNIEENCVDEDNISADGDTGGQLSEDTLSEEVGERITSCAIVVNEQSKQYSGVGGPVNDDDDTDSLLSSENSHIEKGNSDVGSDFVELYDQPEIVVVPNIAERVKSRSRVGCLTPSSSSVGQGNKGSDEEKKTRRKRKRTFREKQKNIQDRIKSQHGQQICDTSPKMFARHVMSSSGDKRHKITPTQRSAPAMIIPNIAESVKNRRSCTFFNHPGQYANSGEGSDGEDEIMKVKSRSAQKSRHRKYSSRERNLKALSLKSEAEYDKHGLVKHSRILYSQNRSNDVKLEQSQEIKVEQSNDFKVDSSTDVISEMEANGKTPNASESLIKTEDEASDLSSAVVVRRRKPHAYPSNKRPEVDWGKVQHSDGSSEQDRVEDSLLGRVAEKHQTCAEVDCVLKASLQGRSDSNTASQARQAEFIREAKVVLFDISTSPCTNTHAKRSLNDHSHVHTEASTSTYHTNTQAKTSSSYANIHTSSPNRHYPTEIHIKTLTSPYTNIHVKNPTTHYTESEDLAIHRSRYRTAKPLETRGQSPCSKCPHPARSISEMPSSPGISCSPRLRLKIRRRSGNKGFSSTLEEIHDCASADNIGCSGQVGTEHCGNSCESLHRIEEKYSSKIHDSVSTGHLSQNCMGRSSSPDMLGDLPQEQYVRLMQPVSGVKSGKRKRERCTPHSSDSESTLEYPLSFEAINKRIKLSPGNWAHLGIDYSNEAENQTAQNDISPCLTAGDTSVTPTLPRNDNIRPLSPDRLRSSSPCFSSPVTTRYFQHFAPSKKSHDPDRPAVGSQSPVFKLSRKQLRHMQSSHSSASSLWQSPQMEMSGLALKKAGLEASVVLDSSMKQTAGRHPVVKRLLSQPDLDFPSAKKTKVHNSFCLDADRSSVSLLESKQKACPLDIFAESSNHGFHSLFQEASKQNPDLDFKPPISHVLSSNRSSTSEHGATSVLPLPGTPQSQLKHFDHTEWATHATKDRTTKPAAAHPHDSDEDMVTLLNIESFSGVSELGFEDLLNQVQTFSSPDKATDTSWGDICDSYLSISFNNHNTQTLGQPLLGRGPAGREARVVSCSPRRKQLKNYNSPLRKRIVEESERGQTNTDHEGHIHKQKTTVSKYEAHCSRLDTAVQQELQTPVKHAASEDLNLSPYIHQVDDVISFNFMSPQRLKSSPQNTQSSSTKCHLSPQTEDRKSHTASHSRRLFSPEKLSAQRVHPSPQRVHPSSHETHKSNIESVLSPPREQQRSNAVSYSRRLFSPSKTSTQKVTCSSHPTHRSSSHSLPNPEANHQRSHIVSHLKRLFSPVKARTPDQLL